MCQLCFSMAVYLILVFFTSVVGNLKPPNGIFRAFFQIAVTHSRDNSNSLENLFSVSVVWSPFPFHQACRQAWWGTAIMHILSVWIVKVQHSLADKILLYGDINLRFLSTKVGFLVLAVIIVVFLVVLMKYYVFFHPDIMYLAQSTACHISGRRVLRFLKTKLSLNITPQGCSSSDLIWCRPWRFMI